ncbi:MAG: sulfatase-like hydrolase/transferase, partial [Lysobacter sp.]|nr:sulfatase-like hydrolase/transferase [Lysobacter sp.]
WGLAGYARATTPNMSRWVAQGQARWHRGIAGAASTRASLGLLFNGVREPGNIAQLRSHEANMLRLAKRAGYRTYWLSTQHGDLLEEIDAPSIDVVRTRDSDAARIAALGDDAILDMLDVVTPDRPRLVVMMLRTAHIPYHDAYRRHGATYRRWPDGEGSTEGARLVNAYDNAIVYQDALVGKLYRRFERGDGDGLFVVTSDHGQMLGEDSVWGHNVLTPQIAQVPMLVRGRGAAQAPLAGNGDWLSHNDLARALAWRMGFSIDNPNQDAGVDYLQGSDLFGDNLFRELRIVDGRLQLGELSGLGHAHGGAHDSGDRQAE